MLAGTLDINMDAGSSYSFSIARKTRDETVDPPVTSAVDISNVTNIFMQVRKKIRDTISVLDMSTTNGGITIDDALNGVLSLHFTALQTAALPKASVYDIEFHYANGDVDHILRGVITTNPEVTRDS